MGFFFRKAASRSFTVCGSGGSSNDDGCGPAVDGRTIDNSVLHADLDHIGDVLVNQIGQLPPTTNTHHDAKNSKWRRRCSLLERIIQEYDTEENHYQERIQSLERQIERLLSARTTGIDDVGDCSDCFQRSYSSETDATASLSRSSHSLVSLPPSQLEDYSARQDIASLEELLSKVLAENKVLTSKVESLTAILKDIPDETTVKAHLPSTIMDLDSALALNTCTPITTSHEEPVTYVLRCKCKKTCKDFHYKGQVNGDLLLKVNEHHEDIWRKIRKEYRKNKKPEHVKYASNEFGRSSFAEHVADHLYKVKLVDEIEKWCKRNVQILEKM